MKKFLLLFFISLYSAIVYADCSQKVQLINWTGSPSTPGVPLDVRLENGGNVKWTPNPSGTIGVFSTKESTISYKSGTAVNTTLKIFDNGKLVASVFTSLVNGCDIGWSQGATSPYRVEIKKEGSDWTITFFNNTSHKHGK